MAFLHPSRTLRPILRSTDADPALKEFTDFGLSYGAGSNLPPKGAYGITRNGDVWQNEENFLGQKYPVWRAEKNWLVEEEADLDSLQNDNVGYRSSFDSAVTAARARAGSSGASPSTTSSSTTSSSGAQLPLNLVGKTWNDGSYTYVVKSTTEAFVPETGVTFRAPDVPTEDRWNRFVKQLQAASLKEGKATGKPKTSGGGGGASPVKTDAPPPPEESITDKVWFWPVAILVPTVAVIGGVLFWPSKKKAAPVAAAAPAVIPVASNPRRRRSKRGKR